MLGLAALGCSGDKKGQIILALQTDMSLPDDITRVKIEVKADGVSKHDRTYVVDPDVEGAEKIPATLSVVAGEKDNQTVELKVIALRPGEGSGGLEPRTLNKTITTIPTERIAMLRVPMQWLCTQEVTEIDDGEYESNCEPNADGKETACINGACKEVRVNSANLPDFNEEAVFGGSDSGSGGTCFPTEECFDRGQTLQPDENCVVTFEPDSDEIINFAVLAKGGGICRVTETGEKLCYVALDNSKDAGWYELEDGETTGGGEGGAGDGSSTGSGGGSTGGGGKSTSGGTSSGTGEAGAGPDIDPQPAPPGRRFQMPQKVCDRINEPDDTKPQAFGVRVSTHAKCLVTKTAKYPTCGPWSSVGGEVEAPPAPPSDDDGDGYTTTDVGGDDCNDGDPEINPGVIEQCGDGKDNDCNGEADDCGNDADGDGYDSVDAGGDDCDDADDTVNPGADEVCDDEIDNDCNDFVDDGCTSNPDADGDGVDSIGAGGTDCDDADNTVFPGALEVCDTVDNDCDDAVDDSCVMDAPQSHRVDFSALDGFQSDPSYAIYQQFSPNIPLDLDRITVTFNPNSSFTRYTVTATGLDWDTDVGDLLPAVPSDISNCDDCFTTVDLDFPFNFYGIEYTTVFPSSNGYLTFGMGDTEYSETLELFLAAAPRIAAFWSDLDSRGGDTQMDEVYYFASATKLVVTYQNIQLFSNSGTSNTFQFVLLDDGTIKVSYDGMDDLDDQSIAGITPGSIGGDCGTLDVCPGGECTNLLYDNNNCGMCGFACGASQFCYNGSCIAGTACTSPGIPCDGTCVGICEPASPAPCDGTCYGMCSGTCSMPDGDGGCAGTCDGDCDGQCYLDQGGVCNGPCSGTCFTTSTCAMTPSMRPCSFYEGQFASRTSCQDMAIDAVGNQFHLICDTTRCQCCLNTTCSDIAGTAGSVCQTSTTVRDTLIQQCMTASACTDTCPSTPPPEMGGCNSLNLVGCSYYNGVSCACNFDMFMCSGGT